MKQHRKKELLQKKYAAISKNFEKLLRDGKHPSEIYSKLEDKFFLDRGTICRIVFNKRIEVSQSD
jgi:hypothetical protein